MAIRILEDRDCKAKLRRMAYQVYEWAFDQPKLIIVGIDERGGHLADLLANHLTSISPVQLEIYNLPRGEQLHIPHGIEGLPLLLVDDVHYTGTTLLHAVQQAAAYKPKQIQVAVLIDRGHHHYPIHAHFVGLELATTLQEYITVTIDKGTGEIAAFLE